jgi:anti-anti-sigma factor
MLKPTVQVQVEAEVLVAEFWDCLRLDPAPVLDLRKKYEAHVRSKGRPQLVVDLLGVGFAGSAALGNFVALQRAIRQNGGRLIFCNVDPTVLEAFRVSKLEPLFAFVADKSAALALANQAPATQAAGEDEPPVQDGAPKPPGHDPTRSLSRGNILRGSQRRKLP